MNLIQRISQFLEQNPGLPLEDVNQRLSDLCLNQEELPLIVKIGPLQNGVSECYYQSSIKQTSITREGISFLHYTPQTITFKAPTSPLLLPDEIECQNITPEVWVGRYGGHARCELKKVLKEQEQDLRDSGKLRSDEYQLMITVKFDDDNPGFTVSYREPPAHDNSFSRNMVYHIQRNVPDYGKDQNLSDYPEPRVALPIMHVGIKSLEFYQKAALFARLNTPMKQDAFLEKVVNAVYQLPVCMQHVDVVIGRSIALSTL